MLQKEAYFAVVAITGRRSGAKTLKKDDLFISGRGLGFALLALFIALSAIILLIDRMMAFSPPGAMTVAGRATMGSAVVVPGSVLTSHEIAHMRYMREEEKLAGDVYQYFAQQWTAPIFSKIAQAEQRHTEVVLGLLNRYGIPDPAAGAGPGQFADRNLADLYEVLVKKGTLSLAEALMVGGLIEEVDIADLENAVASTNRQDIIQVYENIHRGSRNHLRSFARALAQLGITYQPQKLGAAEVQAILSSPMENGPPL